MEVVKQNVSACGHTWEQILIKASTFHSKCYKNFKYAQINNSWFFLTGSTFKNTNGAHETILKAHLVIKIASNVNIDVKTSTTDHTVDGFNANN